MKVKFLDLKQSYVELKEEIDFSIQNVLNSGWYILGNEVEEFENNWANYCGSKYAIGVGNGLDALYLSLIALDLKHHEEVIVPANTYIATLLAIEKAGGKPILVEPNYETYNINPKEIETKISSKTKVILPVHLYGLPCEIDSVSKIAKKHQIKVLEDAAQAHGSTYKEKRIGSHSDLIAWSFYPGKNLGCFGDGGAITTNNQELKEKLTLLRNYGSKIKYINEIKGVNSRLDPIQASILKVKLKLLDSWNLRRRKIALDYLEGLQKYNYTSIKETQGIITDDFPKNKIILPTIESLNNSSWHLFVIRVSNRDQLISHLRKAGIESMIHYPKPPHLQNAFKSLGIESGKLALTESISNTILSLPCCPHQKENQTNYVIDNIKQFLDKVI